MAKTHASHLKALINAMAVFMTAGIKLQRSARYNERRRWHVAGVARSRTCSGWRNIWTLALADEKRGAIA